MHRINQATREIMMIKRSIFTIGLLASSAAIAAESNYFYVGGNLGQARTTYDSNPAIVGGASATYDSSVSVWGAFGGYQINKYVGVEARYITFGDTNLVVNRPAGATIFSTIQVQGWGG